MSDKDYAFHPINQPELIKYYYAQRDTYWVPADIDMKQDRQDWDSIKDENIKKFVIGILKFFVPADGIVAENIFKNFQTDTSMYKEATAFYAIQGAMEMIHSETYSLMSQALIRDRKTLDDIFTSIYSTPVIKDISNFMFEYMDRKKTLLERIVGFACIEGILFNSAFAAVYWIKKKNILRGFCKANEFIARDEGIHTKFACTLFHTICRDHKKLDQAIPDPKSIYRIIEEAVEVNRKFIRDILPVDLIGMKTEDLVIYTKCTADALLNSLGFDKIYNTENPFDWMAVISLPNRTNFFEDKVSEYAKQSTGDFNFDLNAYF